MTLPEWNDRPIIIANLINPAFCGKILYNCIKAYIKEKKSSFPFALTFFVLPIILHKNTRELLPSTSKKLLHSWLDENNEIKILFSKRVQNFLPFTKESLMFLITHKNIIITKDGLIETKKLGNSFSTEENSTEILECFKKAELLGRLLAKSGTLTTLYSSIGVKP